MALKEREGRDGAICNSAPVSIGDLGIFRIDLNFDDLGGCSGEEGEAESVATRPGDGEARNRKGEAVVQRVYCR